MTLRILHLSDLHVNQDEESYLRTVGQALCADLEKFVKEGRAPHLICVTGDLIHKGQNAATELPLAQSLFLEPIAKVLNLTQSDLFLIAGNHEIDRTQVSEPFEHGLQHTLTSQEAFRRFHKEALPDSPNFALMSRKLQAFRDFKQKLTNPHLVASSFFFDTYVFNKNDLKIGIVALNSAWRCSQHGSDDRRLIIGEQVLHEAIKKIGDCNIRICLCHHPFEMMAEWDAKPISRKAIKHFDLLLNGHVHDSDAISGSYLLGQLFSSTAGSLRPNDPFSSYTMITLDLRADKIVCDFRKWYPNREEFDEDTSKCASGSVEFCGIKTRSQNLPNILEISTIRNGCRNGKADADLVSPIEGVESIELREVFVQPVISDKSTFDKDDTSNTYDLVDLIKSTNNLLFIGRSEYGKTTVLRYIEDYILRNDTVFPLCVPVYMRFTDVPKTNSSHMIRVLKKVLPHTTEAKIESLIKDGQLVLLIDDFDDRQESDREKKSKVLREFANTYKKCRFILTTAEPLVPSVRLELLTVASDFNAKQCYISCLNTARIRELLGRWKSYHSFEVNTMLEQILYYFQHFQIPVTPLAVTLFLGVLFRNKKDKNIRNEAYLIENYLETILEKLNPGDHDSDLDFKDKEDFLAHIAAEMVRSGKHQWKINEFEKAKLDYFDQYDEDVPHHSLFETFFRKGILVRDDGVIYFKRRFWFHFFLAKALEKNPQEEKLLLARPDVLKFAKALAYKAGLTRNDIDLLKWVDTHTMAEVKPILELFGSAELGDSADSAPLIQISQAIEQEIKDKNKAEEVDKRRDVVYLSYEEDGGKVGEEEVDRLTELITLQSDVIRNTTKIHVAEKRRFIHNNVKSYIGLMWGTLESVKTVFEKSSEDDLIKLFFRGKKDATTVQRIRYITSLSQKIVHQIIPISVLLFMADRLGNPKLAKSFRALADNAKTRIEKLFFSILHFSQAPAEGIKSLKLLITPESSATEDFIIYSFLRCYCHENQVSDAVLHKIITLMDMVRRKYATEASRDIPYFKDSFRSDLKHELKTKHIH